MDENKRKALENALKTIEKEFGKGAVMRLGEMPKLQVDEEQGPHGPGKPSEVPGSLALKEGKGVGPPHQQKARKGKVPLARQSLFQGLLHPLHY